VVESVVRWWHLHSEARPDTRTPICNNLRVAIWAIHIKIG